jgi:hypothetical protein
MLHSRIVCRRQVQAQQCEDQAVVRWEPGGAGGDKEHAHQEDLGEHQVPRLRALHVAPAGHASDLPHEAGDQRAQVQAVHLGSEEVACALHSYHQTSGLQDGGGVWRLVEQGLWRIKGSPSGPVKRLERELRKHCRVVSMDEFRTSKLHFDCKTQLHNQYSKKRCKDGVVKTVKVHSVLHCQNTGCNGMTVNRDVNAARNILRLLRCRLEGHVRPVEYSRSVTI